MKPTWGAAALVLLGGCVDQIAGHSSTIGEVIRDCVVPAPGVVRLALGAAQ